jgi:hypothetical protein
MLRAPPLAVGRFDIVNSDRMIGLRLRWCRHVPSQAASTVFARQTGGVVLSDAWRRAGGLPRRKLTGAGHDWAALTPQEVSDVGACVLVELKLRPPPPPHSNVAET